MDLKQLNVAEAANKGATIELVSPYDGEKLTYEGEKGEERVMHLTVVGRDSDAYRKGFRQLVERRMKRQQKRGAAATMSLDEIEQETADALAACVTGGKVFLDGKEVSVTQDVARTLFSEPGYVWIRNQVEAFMEDRANFLPR